MGGKTKTTTTQTPQVTTPELSGLTASSARRAQEFQDILGLNEFAQATPTRIAGLSARERQAYEMIPQLGELGRRRVTGADILNSPAYAAANQAYERAIMPGIENRAAVSGLGRSTALLNADAAARAQYLQPTIESEFGREERGLDAERQAVAAMIQALSGAGATERGIEQAGYQSEAEDRLRRQALAEQGVYGPLGQLIPSAVGQQSKTVGKQGLWT